MPRPRLLQPPSPPPLSLEARHARLLHEWRITWRDLVVHESWRPTCAEGRRTCGAAEFARGELSLIDQGLPRPPDPNF